MSWRAWEHFQSLISINDVPTQPCIRKSFFKITSSIYGNTTTNIMERTKTFREKKGTSKIACKVQFLFSARTDTLAG